MSRKTDGHEINRWVIALCIKSKGNAEQAEFGPDPEKVFSKVYVGTIEI
jgi:hypothetical protein